jgi:hypothetical protein
MRVLVSFFFASILLTLPLWSACGDDDSNVCAVAGLPGATAGQRCDADSDCAPVGDRAGLCVAGICGAAPDDGECAEDGTSKGCPGGFRCRQITVESGTHAACLPDCGCGTCAGECDAQGSCQPTAEDSCDPRECTIARGPALTCKTPPALGEGPYFTNVSDQWLGTVDGTRMVGNVLASVDLNEDGYPDLVAHNGDRYRDRLDADPPRRYKRVLINEAAPGGGRRLVDFTDESGLTATRDASELGRASGFAIFADVNNDGHLDAFTGTPVHGDYEDHGDRSEILLGAGDGTFTLAPQSDTSPTGRMATHAAAFLDYDLDGNVDVFVGNQYGTYGLLNSMEQDRLYRGDGTGAFTDVTTVTGLTTDGPLDSHDSPRPTDGVTVCDVDSDGDMDIITSSYGRTFNFLWENVNGSEFRSIGPEVGADADDNEDYSDNELFKCHCDLNPGPECDPDPGSPRISCGPDYWNVGMDDQPWRLAGTTFSTVCGDIDNDLDLDLFEVQIRHWYHGQSSDPSGLLLNDGAAEGWAFERPANDDLNLERDWDRVDWNDGDFHAGFFDFDNDGRLDIYLPSGLYPGCHATLFRQQPSGMFQDVTEASGAGHYYSYGLAFADYDRDGDLDITVGSTTFRCSSDPECTWRRNDTHIYRNEVGQDANWLAVRVVGAGEGASNVAGIGARIVVTADGVSQTREVQGGYGHRGIQHNLVQYFGLGASCLAEEVTVRWPNRDFTSQTFRWVPANYFVTIDEATGAITYEEPAAP